MFRSGPRACSKSPRGLVFSGLRAYLLDFAQANCSAKCAEPKLKPASKGSLGSEDI